MKSQFKDMVKQARIEWETLQACRKAVIRVGTATCGRSAGAFKTLNALKTKAEQLELDCRIIKVGCLGL